jgi:uncharacterized membrane protein YphA (DoxX/SURF4 family)
MRIVTHADRSSLTRPDLDLAAIIHSHARTRALPLWIGRLLFGGYFIYNALNHFLNLEAMAAYAASKNVPVPEVAVALSGLLLLVGGLSVVSGQWPRVGALLIAVFLAAVTPTMHNFWALEGQARAMDLVQFTKNLALLGATFLAMAIPEPWNGEPLATTTTTEPAPERS